MKKLFSTDQKNAFLVTGYICGEEWAECGTSSCQCANKCGQQCTYGPFKYPASGGSHDEYMKIAISSTCKNENNFCYVHDSIRVCKDFFQNYDLSHFCRKFDGYSCAKANNSKYDFDQCISSQHYR